MRFIMLLCQLFPVCIKNNVEMDAMRPRVVLPAERNDVAVLVREFPSVRSVKDVMDLNIRITADGTFPF